MGKIFAIISLCLAINSQAQFTGHSGVYYLGTANIPINSTIYSKSNISGVVIRFKWNDIEPIPDNFNWSYVDAELAKATANNKKICLQPLGTPNWLERMGATHYYYIDKNTYHPTYGQVLSGVIPWDTIYVNRYKSFLQNLASKYANDTTVSYINTIGGAFSRGLPDSVLIDTVLFNTQPFWLAHNYNADTLVHIMNQMTDYYMDLFPNTHLWCSVDYVRFQDKATGQANNYLATQYTSYGIENYPARFGLWREDVSGCNPNISLINTASHWKIIHQHPCRTGAQMLWNVQDGPARMNKCGIVPNTKSVVLDAAVNNGLALGMRYLEIYGADISDASLSTSIQRANNYLNANGLLCNTTTGLNNSKQLEACSIYQNTAINALTVRLDNNRNQTMQIEIYNLMGGLVKEISVNQTTQIDLSDLPIGLYLVKQKEHPHQALKFIKQ